MRHRGNGDSRPDPSRRTFRSVSGPGRQLDVHVPSTATVPPPVPAPPGPEPRGVADVHLAAAGQRARDQLLALAGHAVGAVLRRRECVDVIHGELLAGPAAGSFVAAGSGLAAAGAAPRTFVSARPGLAAAGAAPRTLVAARPGLAAGGASAGSDLTAGGATARPGLAAGFTAGSYLTAGATSAGP